MSPTFEFGETVVVPWCNDEVLATVTEIYGHAPDLMIIVTLSPELSGFIVDEPTTLAVRLASVRRPGVAA